MYAFANATVRVLPLISTAASAFFDALAALEELEADGLVAHEHGRWVPTHRGWLCGNELYGRLLDLAP